MNNTTPPDVAPVAAYHHVLDAQTQIKHLRAKLVLSGAKLDALGYCERALTELYRAAELLEP